MQAYNIKLGISFSLLSFFTLAVMGALAKVASTSTPTLLIVLIQNFVSFLIIIPFALKAGLSNLKTKKIYLHILRAVAGTVAWYCLFKAINLLSLNTGVLLCYAAPLWLPIIASIFFKEQVYSKVWTGVIIGFFGILFVLGLHLNKNSDPIGLCFGLIAGITLAIALITVRLLNRTETTTTILFYYFLIATLLLLPLAWHDLPKLNMQALPYLIAIGACLAASQLFLVKAYQYASAVKLSPYIYSTIIFSILIDSLVWHTLISSLQLLGMLLVIVGGVVAAQAPQEKPI